MYRNLLSVGGLTAFSRVTGFVRDLALSALIGAGPIADAFFVALRLPNQFRAIFGEGAFNAAYIPSYSRILAKDGPTGAKHFASQIFVLLIASQLVLLAIGLFFTPQLVRLIAPGFDQDPERFGLAVSMTRITFPYLAFVTLVTLHTATQNAHGRFAVGAFVPVLLNVFVVAFLAIAFLFPNAGIAASWGVLASGAAQFFLIASASRRQKLFGALKLPNFSYEIRRFFSALGPATLGSAGQQILIFVDTILASALPIGAVSSLYYAERLYQLPQGVISVAAATVLLPDMSRRLAKGDIQGTLSAQNRTFGFTLLATAPFFVTFLMVPDALMRAAFMRGAFDNAAAIASAKVLAAYGLAIIPIVLIRLASASFQARGDTSRPMLAFLAGLAFNLALKIALVRSQGAAGLAIATAAGAWINFTILIIWGLMRNWTRPDRKLVENIAIVTLCTGLLAFEYPMLIRFAESFAGPSAFASKEILVLIIVSLAFLSYGAMASLAALAFGRSPLRQLF